MLTRSLDPSRDSKVSPERRFKNIFSDKVNGALEQILGKSVGEDKAGSAKEHHPNQHDESMRPRDSFIGGDKNIKDVSLERKSISHAISDVI